MSNRPNRNQATSNRPDRQLHLLVALIAALAVVLSLAAVSAASVGAATPLPGDDHSEHRSLLADSDEASAAAAQPSGSAEAGRGTRTSTEVP